MTSWSLFGSLGPISTTAFWISTKPSEVCSANQWDALKTATAAASIGQQKGPVLWDNARLHVTQPTLQKLNGLGYEVWPYLPYSPDLLSTSYHSFKHLGNFLQGKWFYNQHKAENAFQEFVESLSMDFYAIGINKLISCWQRCVDCNGSYFQ